MVRDMYKLHAIHAAITLKAQYSRLDNTICCVVSGLVVWPHNNTQVRASLREGFMRFQFLFPPISV